MLLCLLAACSPFYVLRAGYEEAKILWHRKPIVEVLHRADLDAAAREKLELVLRVRRFVEQELGFDIGGSYASITEIADPPRVYVVTAAPRTSLEPYTWWFPIVGRVAYKGFFDEAAARREARRLEAKGYDTYIRTAVAFSTLGWFSDPPLPHLLQYDKETLANIVIHELFHTTFYLPGQTAFNESLANFAGHRGAIAFFAAEHGHGAEVTQQALATWENELRVAAFVAAAARRLETLYESPLAEAEKLRQREILFARLQEEFRALPGPVRQNSDLATVRLNNAVVLHYLVYLQDLELFEAIFQHNGHNLRETLHRIMATARGAADPFEKVRELRTTYSVRTNSTTAFATSCSWPQKKWSAPLIVTNAFGSGRVANSCWRPGSGE
ncbi:MAG: aminopeptidase [Candidatus Binatia bacterium]|nr:aminopeptidase [Candidatus Binatia bacterium]